MTPILYIAAIIIIAIFLTIATEIEWFGWTTITILGCVAAVQFFHIFDILLFAKTNVIQTLSYVISYIAIGVVWSFVKWFSFLVNERNKNREWLKGELKRTDRSWSRPVLNIPQAADNKGRIIAWISYWPFSFIGTLLNDPFKKAINFIFNQFKSLYQRMANSLYKEDIDSLNNTIEILRLKEEEAHTDTHKKLQSNEYLHK